MGQRDPRVDAYIAKSADFAQPILAHLRALVHEVCPHAEETLKWRMPAFLHNGRILCGLAAFKQHASFWFWRGMNVTAGWDAKDGMGAFGRLTSLKDLAPRKELVAHLEKAMQFAEAGAKFVVANKKVPKPAPKTPDDFAAALKKNKKALAVYEGFSPSCRREYVEWIGEAKREETRAKRLAQAVEWIAEGKQRNWKYQKPVL